MPESRSEKTDFFFEKQKSPIEDCLSSVIGMTHLGIILPHNLSPRAEFILSGAEGRGLLFPILLTGDASAPLGMTMEKAVQVLSDF